MPSSLPLEHRLVIACSHMEPDLGLIRGLMCESPDWKLVTWLAQVWGTVPLVDRELRRHVDTGQLPGAVYLHLRGLLRQAAAQDLARRELLLDALRRLADAKLRAIVSNETAWATLLYPDVQLHPLNRIELVVQKADLDRAERLLLRDAADDAGCPNPPTGWTDAQRALIDLSPTPFGKIAERIAVPIEALWERVRPVEIDGVPAWRFAHEDLLLQLTIHLTHAQRYVGQLRTLRDIGQVCRQNDGRIDWGRLAERSQAYGLAKPLHHALRQAREWVGADVPDAALRRLRGSFRQLPLEDRFLRTATRRALGAERPPTGLPWGLHDLAVRLLQSRGAVDAVGVLLRKLLQVGRSRLQRGPVEPAPRWSRWRGVIPGRRLPSLAIVLPIYRAIPDAESVYAIDRTFELLRHGDIYMIAPQSLDASFYQRRYGAPIVRFPDNDLCSASMYSRLLLTDRFYAVFARYEFVLITQDDVFVIRDDVPRWLKAPYDYLGAPWIGAYTMPLDFSPRAGLRDITHVTYVGNGGFSLRRVAACRQLFAEFESERETCHRQGVAEDMFFAHFGYLSQHFRMPNVRVASDFAWESDLPRMHAICHGRLPMAIHGYLKFNRKFFLETILPAATAGRGQAPG